MPIGTCKGVAFPGREDIQMYYKRRKTPKKSSKDKIIELILEGDRIHTENDGVVTIDEIRVRMIIRVNLNIMALSNKLLALKKFVCKKLLVWIWNYF